MTENEIARQIVDAALKAHRALGPGLLGNGSGPHPAIDSAPAQLVPHASPRRQSGRWESLPMEEHEFEAFSPGLFDFLEELEHNNNRDWFNANKARYESLVREPARAFVRAMATRLEQVTAYLEADDRKVGGSLMRIYRDTRFSKDKTPYKTNVGIQFRHLTGRDVHAPGLYVHLDTRDVFIGAGMWRPDGPSLAKIRQAIDAERARFRSVVEAPAFAKRFERPGQSLKRVPKGYSQDHPMADELKRKSHIATESLTRAQAVSPDFPDFVRERLESARDFLAFLCDAIGLRF